MEPKFDPILGKLREKDKQEGKPFDPKGTYPDLTAGGLIARELDAIVDLRTSFIFRSAGGDKSISSGAAKLTSIFGNVVKGQPFNATHFKAVGFNALNPENVMNKTINNDGTITESEDHKIAYVHVIAGQTGSGHNNGYIISSKDTAETTVYRVGFVTADPTTAVSATVLSATSIDTTRSAYIPPQEGWLLLDCLEETISDLCVHLAWSYNPQNWLAFEESIIELPTVHSWGMGKAGDKMDEIDFLEQTIAIRVDRTLLSALNWTQNRQAGESTYNDETITTEYGEILAVGESTITVGETVFTRDSEHDTADAYAWTNDDVTIFTVHEEPTAPVYTYVTEDLKDLIKPSTINLNCYGLSSGYFFVVAADGTLTLNTSSTEEDPSTFTTIYLYYELASETLISAELDPLYKVDDFGTEEFLNTTIAPTYATFLYLPNMIDQMRAIILNANQANIREEKLLFENTASSIYASDVNCTVKEVVYFNCSGLKFNGNSVAADFVIQANTLYDVAITASADNAIVIIKTEQIS